MSNMPRWPAPKEPGIAPQIPARGTGGGGAAEAPRVFRPVSPPSVEEGMEDAGAGSGSGVGEGRATVTEPLASLISGVPGICLICDGEGCITMWNRRSEVLLGYPASELSGRNLADLVPDDEQASLVGKLRSLPDTGPFEAMVGLRARGGNRISCALAVAPVEIGGASAFVVMGIPVAEGHGVDEALKESEQRFKELSELLPQAVYETDEHGILTFANRPSIEWFGYTREDFRNPFLIFRVISPEEREKAIQNFQKTLRGERSEPAEYTAVKKDGTRFTMMTYASPIIRHGRPVGLRGLAIDITERKRMEEALQAANRKIMLLNSITRHDILNTVTALMGYTALAKDSTELPEIASLIGKIEKTTQRIRQQIEFTRDYQELGVQGPQWQSVQEVALSSTAPLRSYGVEMEIRLEGLQVYADMLLGKVFYNLVDNSIRHGGPGLSAIRITLREDPHGSIIEYTDNGTGVAGDQKERIFAYGVGRGTGLGLFLCREILSLTEIIITETGEPGRGARFEISIPAGCCRFSPSP